MQRQGGNIDLITGKGLRVYRVCLAGSRLECWVTARLDESV